MKLYITCLCRPRAGMAKTLLVMKLIAILLTTAILQVSATTFGQKVSLNKSNANLANVFTEIRKQTGYDFLYSDKMMSVAKPISIQLKNVELETALKRIFSDQPLTYEFKGKSVIVTAKEPSFLDKVVDALTPPIDVRGTVYDEKGYPMAGVTIKVKGTSKATTSSNDGKFYLPGVDDKAVIQLSFIGYKTKDFPATGNFENIHLEIGTSELQEVVVAYGKTTQQALTGSVTVVKGEQIESLPNRSFDKSLQGLVPGLQITNGTGQPGGGVSNIVLRGIASGTDASFGSTVRNPLIIIDGIPISQDLFQTTIAEGGTPITNPLAQLNPSDIESISVLKDASAIAMYGSKASNGVILVTTKKGKIGTRKFNLRHQVDFASRLKDKVEVLDQKEYLNLLYQTYRNTDPVQWTDAAILSDLKNKFPIQPDGSFYPAPNWNKEIYKSGARTLSNDLSISGGSENTLYYVGLEYTDQDGIVASTGYKRTSTRINLETKAANWFKLGLNSTLSYNKQSYTNNLLEGASSDGLLAFISPLNPVRNVDGSYVSNYPYGTPNFSSRPQANPAAEIEYNINRVVSYRGLAKLYGQIDFSKRLKLISSFGTDFMLSETKQKIDPRLGYAGIKPGIGQIEDYDVRRGNLINNNLLSYNQNFSGSHNIDILLGEETQVLTQKRMRIRVRNLRLPYFDQVVNGDINSFSGDDYKETLLSFFGQANYNFKNKYFLSTSIRRDGSSKFGENKRFGTYWSTGLGWVVSSESFMNQQHLFDYLKVRGSIGQAGNSGAISRNTRYDLLDVTNYTGNVAVVSYIPMPANPNIRWESTFTWDVGIEMRFFKERLSLTADAYKRKTTDLIYNTVLPPLSGYLNALSNIGDVNNSGYEFALSADILRKKEFKWNINLNWSTNRNRLVKQNEELVSVGNLINKVGENFNSFYLVRWAGVDPSDGRPQWLDASGNVTKTYDQKNRVIVGKPQPDGFGSVRTNFVYKNWDLGILFNYQYGYKIYDQLSANLVSDGVLSYINQTQDALDYWQKPGDIAENPRRLLNNPDDGYQPSTRYLFNGDYIRLSNLSLTYSLPQPVIQKWNLNSLRLFVQANNFALWTSFKGQDPDLVSVSGSVSSPYAKQRSLSLGLNVSF